MQILILSIENLNHRVIVHIITKRITNLVKIKILERNFIMYYHDYFLRNLRTSCTTTKTNQNFLRTTGKSILYYDMLLKYGY